MGVHIIDLSSFVRPNEVSLLGFERGLQLRKDGQLDTNRMVAGQVELLLPNWVHTIDVDCMEGLLSDVAFWLGSVAFQERWHIRVPSCPGADSIVQQAVKRIMDKRDLLG